MVQNQQVDNDEGFELLSPFGVGFLRKRDESVYLHTDHNFSNYANTYTALGTLY